MQLVGCQNAQSKCGKISLTIQNDVPLGELHDFLMAIKGEIVDRMIRAHREEESASNAQRDVVEAPKDCCNQE